jgi:tetrahydromethanopterin S-methyltransferase subunit F
VNGPAVNDADCQVESLSGNNGLVLRNYVEYQSGGESQGILKIGFLLFQQN